MNYHVNIDMAKILEGPSFSIHNNPKKLIIMLHGYGDNADNFIHLSKQIDQEDWGVNYIALNAPNIIRSYPTGYQWFDLYPNGIYISEAGPQEIEIIKKDIKDSVLKIEQTIKFYIQKFNINLSDCIVLGFSQGGMMTFEFGNHVQDQLCALAILSGRIMNRNVNIFNSYLLNTPIFISHGDKDDVLPISNFNSSVEYLKKNRFNYESHIIKGDTHIISSNTINLLQKFIKKKSMMKSIIILY